ncbi:MAG: GerMN domain-containing protein [Chthonomonadales bacterium]
MRRAFVVLLVLVAVAAGVFVATRRPKHGRGGSGYSGNGVVRIPRARVSGNEVDLQSTPVRIGQKGDAILLALEAVLQAKPEPGQPRIFPPGVRVLSVRVEDGVAKINMSDEFNQLRQSGDTTEALAQRALIQTLAQFPQVRSMLVLVGGKPFESEHTDWTEPIPVRGESALGAPQ